MIEAICVGGWNRKLDQAAPVWLTVGKSYPVLQVLLRRGGTALVRVPAGEGATPTLWPVRYFEFDSASEDLVAQSDDGDLSLAPRRIADIDWFTFFEDPPDGMRDKLAEYLRGG